MGVVQYSGLKKLGDDAGTAETLIQRYMEKFDRYFPDHQLIVHVKLHNIGGKVKYSFHTRMDNPHTIAKAEAADWDLRRTVHMVMKALHNEIEHIFKKQAQKQERFHPKKAKRGTDTRVKLRLKRRTRLL